MGWLGFLMCGVAIGFAIGWVIAEQPEWARNLRDTVYKKLFPRG